jgi:hypothetical protein
MLYCTTNDSPVNAEIRLVNKNDINVNKVVGDILYIQISALYERFKSLLLTS